MTTHSKELCPCGSGKKYKHCHQRIDAARQRNLLLSVAAIVVVGGTAALAGPALMAKLNEKPARTGVAADSAARAEVAARPGANGVVGTSSANGAASIGVVNPNGVAGPPLRDPAALRLTPPNSGNLLPGEHPKDYEFDVARNRYYDPRPGHMHWHTGPPPADPNAPVAAPNVVVTTPGGQPVKVTSTTTSK